MCKNKDVLHFFGCDEIFTDLKLWKALLAEFFGTMFLVFIGCGSCMTTTNVVQIALAFGLVVGTMVQCTCHVSGGHINPAVTCGMLAIGKISVVRALFYIITQCVGGIVGAALIKAVTPIERFPSSEVGLTVGTTREVMQVQALALGLSKLGRNVSVAEGFGVELLITFILVFTVCAVCDSNRTDIKGSAPLAIGFAVSSGHLFAVRYTGSSMNPARTFGPAVISNQWTDHWVYWLGPILGGIGAAVLYHFAFRAPDPPTPTITLIRQEEKFLQRNEP